MKARETANKLAAQVEELNKQQEAALAAASAEGVSDEESKKHFALCDELQAKKDKAKADYHRWDKLAHDQQWERGPGTSPLSQEQPHDPTSGDSAREFVAANVKVPARCRRDTKLTAFKGPDGAKEAYAAGLWYAGALFGHQSSMQQAADMGLGFAKDPQANLTGLSNQSGGFFVPDVIETRIIEITQEYGVGRRVAENVPMSSDSITTPRWMTAMTAYWIGRGTAPTSSDPAWNAVQLIAKDMGAMTKISRQLNEDSLIDLGEKVTMNIARAFALAEDNALFLGDGTSTYGGVNGLVTRLAETANANCVVTATGHTTVGALTNSDFSNVVGKAPAYGGASWRWFCHKQVWAQSMALLQLAGGGNNVSTIAAGGQMNYLGYPVEFVNVMPSAPGTGTIAAYFAALEMGVKIGTRRGRTVQAGFDSDDFTKQLMTILGTQRLDINVHTVLDPLGDTNAPAGPIIALKLG